MAASMYMMLFGEFVYMPAEIHNVNLGKKFETQIQVAIPVAIPCC